MKRFLLSVVVAMLTTMGLMAEHWTGPTPNDYQYKTLVVVTPKLNDTGMTSTQTVEIAAFIGNECRGVSSSIEANGKLSLQVYFNGDESAADVNFKAYYNGVEYIMKETATLSGINSFSITFNIQVPTKIELSDFRLNLDIDAHKSADLYDYLKFYFGTTTTDAVAFSALVSYSPVTFTTTDTEHITLSGSTVTAVKSTNARGVKVTAASGALTSDGYVQVAPIDYEVVAIRFGSVDTSEGTVALNPQTRFDLDIESTTNKRIDFADYIQYQIISDYTSTGEETTWVALNKSLTPGADYELLNVPVTTITIPGYTVAAQTVEGKLTYELAPTVGTGEEGAQITLACTTSTNAQLSNTDAKIYVKPYIYVLRSIALSTENAAIPLLGSTTYTLTPTPTNATGFKAEDYVLKAATPDGYPADWKTAESTAYDNANQTLSVKGYYIGNYTLTLYQKDGVTVYKDVDDKTVTASIKVGAQYAVFPGWDWVSYYYTNDNMGTPTALRTSMQLSEVRSQLEACYWDPDYNSGQFFGSLTSIVPSTAYMVNSELTEANEVNVFDGTNAIGTKALYKNYTWVGYPYQYAFSAAQILSGIGVTFSNGDKVIGKNASLEYQGGAWTGSLTTFEAGHSYIFYVQTGSGQTITWKSAAEMGQPTSSMSAPARTSDRQDSPWQYDSHAFSNNMTIVAKVETDAECQIGAFVGDECRGEGKQVEFEGERYHFITVHGQPGETVSFKAFDGVTYTDLNTTLPFASISGSLTDPMMLCGNTETNGIAHIAADTDAEAHCLDLTGRAASTDAHGIFVVRQNGTTRKVVK